MYHKHRKPLSHASSYSMLHLDTAGVPSPGCTLPRYGIRPDYLSIELTSRTDHAFDSARKGSIVIDRCKYCFRLWKNVILRPLVQTNWAFNFLVGEMTPLLQEVIEWRLYPMHGFFCACSFVVGAYTCFVVDI